MIATPPPVHKPVTKSPFKFLDAYTAQDKDCFFGRELEQQRLVELIFRSKLLLIYGQSGTGKSSLVQCGLASVMPSTDYFPLVVRRRSNFIKSLQVSLNTLLDHNDETDPIDALNRLSGYLMRPVYLIFDQFEEIFISGDRPEQIQFFELLKALYASPGQFKLLLVMREEYIAYLYPFEDNLPTLFDFRLRLEPMSEKNLRAVIVGTCEVAGIRINDPDQTVPAIIATNQSSKNPFQLPYLQVYLDRLWRKAINNQNVQPIIFSPELVSQVGKIDDVLAQFVTEQSEEISDKLADDEKPAVKATLEALVTYEGTRRECTVDMLINETGYRPALIHQIGEALEAARLVQFEDGSYELAHDSLARVIDQGRSTEQRQINDILKRLKEAYQEYVVNHGAQDLLLPQRRLAEIGLYEIAIRTELERSAPNGAGILQFITASISYLEQKRLAEVDEQRRKNNRLRLTIAGVTGLLILAVIAMGFALKQKSDADKAKEQAEAALNSVTLQRAKAAYSKGLQYAEYNEPNLAKKSFGEATNLINQLPPAPNFPNDEQQEARRNLAQLKAKLQPSAMPKPSRP